MKYHYACTCKRESIKDFPIGKAPDFSVCECGGDMYKIVVPPKVIFQGDGFAKTGMR